jgi:hypothetical protein
MENIIFGAPIENPSKSYYRKYGNDIDDNYWEGKAESWYSWLSSHIKEVLKYDSFLVDVGVPEQYISAVRGAIKSGDHLLEWAKRTRPFRNTIVSAIKFATEEHSGEGKKRRRPAPVAQPVDSEEEDNLIVAIADQPPAAKYSKQNNEKAKAIKAAPSKSAIAQPEPLQEPPMAHQERKGARLKTHGYPNTKQIAQYKAAAAKSASGRGKNIPGKLLTKGRQEVGRMNQILQRANQPGPSRANDDDTQEPEVDMGEGEDVEGTPRAGPAGGGSGGGEGGVSNANMFYLPTDGHMHQMTDYDGKRVGIKEYCKSFPIVMDFENPNLAETKLLKYNTTPVSSQNGYLEATIQHQGHMIPYFHKLCAMEPEDWVFPPNCYAYEVVEFGFFISHLQVVARPNAKGNPNEVKAPTPCHTKMWMFIDENNDYGRPEFVNPNTFAHNDMFRDQDGESDNIDDRKLPYCPQRTIRQKQLWFNYSLDRRRIKAVATNPGPPPVNNIVDITYKNPNDLYNFHLHSGYKEFTLADVEEGIGFSYKVKQPKIYTNQLHSSDTLTGLHDYETATISTSVFSNHDTMTPIFDSPGLNAQTTFKRYAGSHIDMKVNREHKNQDNSQSRNYAHKTWAEFNIGANDYKVITRGQEGVDNCNPMSDHSGIIGHIQERPPLVFIGVKPQVEFENGLKELKYLANGEITYFATVKWHFSDKTIRYMNQGNHNNGLNIGQGLWTRDALDPKIADANNEHNLRYKWAQYLNGTTNHFHRQLTPIKEQGIVPAV